MAESVGNGRLRHRDRRTGELRRWLAEIAPGRSKVGLEPRPPQRLDPRSPGHADRFVDSASSSRRRRGERRIAREGAALRTAEGHLVVDQERYQPFMIAARAAVEPRNDVDDQSAQPVGAASFQLGRRRRLEALAAVDDGALARRVHRHKRRRAALPGLGYLHPAFVGRGRSEGFSLPDQADAHLPAVVKRDRPRSRMGAKRHDRSAVEGRPEKAARCGKLDQEERAAGRDRIVNSAAEDRPIGHL